MAKRRVPKPKKKAKGKYVMICPKCDSKDVTHDWSSPATVGSTLVNVMYKCNNCGHEGMVFPEVPENKVPKNPKPLKYVKERTLVDTTFGRGEFGILHLISPLLIISGLLSFFFGTETIKIQALLILLPSGIFFTFLPYGRRLIEEHKLVRAICIALMVYAILFSPLGWFTIRI